MAIHKKNISLLCLLGGSILLSCNSHEHHDDAEEPHHHILFTAYTPAMELFAESHPFIVNKEGSLLCHLTNLKDFKPVTEGTVTATLKIGDKQSTAKADSPSEPGIWELQLTPTKEGNAKLTVTYNGKEGFQEFTLEDLRAFTDEENAHKDAQSREIKSASGVTFTKEQSWSTDFSTALVQKKPIGSIIRTVAQILPSQSDEVNISAKTDGIVTLSSNNLTEGCAISSGQAICDIDASVTAQNNLSMQQNQAKIEMDRTRTEYERLRTLRQDKLVVESDVQSAKAAYEAAETAYNALRKNFKGGRQIVSAPRAGYLKQLLVSTGQYVSAGQPLAVITQSKTLLLRANVQSSYYPELKNVNGANLRTLNSPVGETHSLKELGGKMTSYGKQTGVNSPLIPVTFEINNVLDLVPGTFVELFITTRSKNEQLVVPAESILEEQGNYCVFVQLTPEFFDKRQVKIGVTDGKETQIISGLKVGERVVAHGAMLVKLQQASGTLDSHAGHNHSH